MNHDSRQGVNCERPSWRTGCRQGMAGTGVSTVNFLPSSRGIKNAPSSISRPALRAPPPHIRWRSPAPITIPIKLDMKATSRTVLNISSLNPKGTRAPDAGDRPAGVPEPRLLPCWRVIQRRLFRKPSSRRSTTLFAFAQVAGLQQLSSARRLGMWSPHAHKLRGARPWATERPRSPDISGWCTKTVGAVFAADRRDNAQGARG